MYAIIKTGGKQYRVEKDAIIDVELLGVENGESVDFNEVRFINDGQNPLIGEPSVSGYVVKGEVIGDAYASKITSVKYKARKNRRTKWGHRQKYTRVKILDIASVKS